MEMATLTATFAALGDPVRQRMVELLADGDRTVSELAARFPISVQAVSKHIKVLAEAGVVSQSQDAQRRPCHLEAEVFDLMTKWIERYRQRAQERFERPAARPDGPANRSAVHRRREG